MNRLEEIINPENAKKEISLGSIRISMRNYLYLMMIKEWCHKEDIDYSVIIDCMIEDFIASHKDDIKQFKADHHEEGRDWLVDTLFGK